jgi:hypothetical protein
MRELLGHGRTIALHATDTDGTGCSISPVTPSPDDTVTNRRAPSFAGPLLVHYRRSRVSAVGVVGDAGVVDFWLERVAFG